MIPKHPHNMLMVIPPGAGLALPPLGPALCAASLDGLGVEFALYEANLDYGYHHLLDTTVLSNLLDRISVNRTSGLSAAKDKRNAAPHMDDLLADIVQNPFRWQRKIDRIDQDLKTMKTDAFYAPEACIGAIGHIKALLSLSSLAYYPSIFQWGRYRNPSIKRWSHLRAFVQQKEINPFYAFFKKRLKARLAENKIDLLILFVSAAGQLPAALTMAHVSKKIAPHLHVALQGEKRLVDGAQNFADSLLPTPFSDALFMRLGHSRISGKFTGLPFPDFSSYPLCDYLTPASVLPFLLPAEIKKHREVATSFLAFLAAHAKTLAGGGILSLDHRLTVGHLAAADMEHMPFSVGVGLTDRTARATGPEIRVAGHGAGLRFVRWQNLKGSKDETIRTLRENAKVGIWNQLDIADKGPDALFQFAATNPNIVHSLRMQKKTAAVFSELASDTAIREKAYQQVADLPGSSFYGQMDEPAYLLLYLRRYTPKELLRLRVREARPRVYQLGADMSYHYTAPKDLPPGYLDEICRMVEAGGSVGEKWVRHNLERAYLIGYVLEKGVIAGNSSLKHPREEYINDVGEQTGLDLSNYLERGYTSVRPEYRGMGIGTKLLHGLTARAGEYKIFSIIGADNIGAQKMALRNNTKQIASFYSQRMGKDLGVWVPAHMLEDETGGGDRVEA